MEQVEREYTPDAAIMGIHLLVGRLGRAAAVRAQREKLMILFENLIFNAISFTPRSGSITVTPRLEDGCVVIEVADTGSGIAPEHLPHVFEQFYTARENKNEGSGLGLYICKLTVEELGGTVCAQSFIGEGTTMMIRIPLP